MSIASGTNSTNINDLQNTSRKIFGSFCVEIFNMRASVLENNNEIKSADINKAVAIILQSTIDRDKQASQPKETLAVIYAMAAIADEIFLSIEWSGKSYWEQNMMEARFFGTQIAGEEIFRKINALINEKDPLSSELAEIYLKMLSLGFKGKYYGDENELDEIDNRRDALFDLISKNDDSVASIKYRLFPRGYAYTMPTIHRKLLPDTTIVTYISTFFVFMFMVISSVIWIFETKDLRHLLTEISAIALRE